MENQINKSLISLRKISNLNEKSRINTINGDIDEFTETTINNVVRVVFDSRQKALKLLMSKFSEARELTKFIIESKKFINYLDIFKTTLIKSKEGLMLYKNNERYRDDLNIRSTIDHIMEDEIPSQIALIDHFLKTCQDSNILESSLP